MLFCDKLQQLRRSAKLTQDEFAAHIGTSRQAVSKWESGTAYPDLKNLQIICEFFRISPDQLLNEKRELTDPNEGFSRFDPNGLGINIRSVRIARGIGQEGLAELLGVSRQSVSKWENGAALPKTELLLTIIKELDTDLGVLLPPIPISEKTAAPQEDATNEATTPLNEPPAPEKRKRKKLLLLLAALVPVLALLVAVLAVGAYLTLPFRNADPFGTLFTDLFFDVDEIGAVCNRWETEGVEITLGNGENAITAKVKASDTAVTVANLSPQPITLPRQNAKAALEASDFHYNSTSPMALSREQYDTLAAFLEFIEKDPNAKSALDGLDQTLESILAAATQTLSPQTQYRLADGQLALEKTVTVEANAAQLSALFKTVADEVKKNEALNGILAPAESAALSETTSLKLDEILRELEREMSATYSSMHLTLSYTVVRGSLTRVTLTEKSTDKDKVQYDTVLEFTPHYTEAKATGFSVKIATKTTQEGVTDTLETEYLYKRAETDQKTELSLTVESRNSISDSNTSQSYTSKETHTLHYDKNGKTFAYRHSIPELESESLLQGVWEWDPSGGLFRFGVTKWEEKWEEDETVLLDTTVATVSVRALGAETLSTGEDLLAMSSESWLSVYRQLPFKKLDTLFRDITGEELGFVYSKQDTPIPASAQKLAERSAAAFKEYAKGEEAKNISTQKIRLYSEDHGLYLLCTYRAAGSVSVIYTNSLTQSEATNYHEAALNGNTISVHHVEKATRQEPTCTSDGKQFYQCTDCEKGYSVAISALEHQYTQKTMSVVTDDGANRIASYEICLRCQDIFQVKISDDGTLDTQKITFYLEPTAGGGYTVADYASRNGIFSIPDALSEALSINTLRLYQSSGYDLIRIPSGIKKLDTSTYFQAGPQVLILPASLTEISNGVFNDVSSLHTIYYCGTEAQWNAVKLNRYRNDWKSANVIFCPDGVAPEVAANSYFTGEKEILALNNAIKQTQSADAAIAFAEKDGVHLLESGVVTDVIVDQVNNTVAVIGAYTNGSQTVSIYDADHFSLINRITVDFAIDCVDAWEGLLALSNSTDGIVTVYRQSDGGVTHRFPALADQAAAVQWLVLMDGYVYYSVQTDTYAHTTYAYKLNESLLQPLLYTSSSPKIATNRSLHRLVVFADLHSPKKIFFVDTQTAEILNSHSFAPQFPWIEEFPYLTVARHSPTTYYDPSGNLLKENPAVSLVKLTSSRNERLASIVVQTDRLNASIYYDTGSNVYLQVKTADGTQRRVDYYATSAILLSNGTLLLYTQNGYGLVAVAP